jgi:DNA-binding CsgD family transcriptional regulator
MGYYARAWPRYWRGQLSESAADSEIAIQGQAGSWSMYLPVAKYWLGLALIELDELEAAESALTLTDEDTWSTTLMYGAILLGRGRLAIASGSPREALMTIEKAGQIIAGTFFFDNPSALPWRSEAALAALQLGDSDYAMQLATDELMRARQFGVPRSIGIALRAAGLAEGGIRGVDFLRESVSVLETSPSKLELARALIDLGALLRRNGSRAAARDPLRRGLAMAEEFGAVRLQRQGRSELVASGAHAPKRALTGRDSLTPSERRVAELAAAGMSNRDIAQSLFVTINAVKWHLRNAYAKLDIASRDELANVLGIVGEQSRS